MTIPDSADVRGLGAATVAECPIRTDCILPAGHATGCVRWHASSAPDLKAG